MQYISLVVNLIHDSSVPSGSELLLLQKVCKTINTKRGMVCFGSQFQMFLQMTSWLCCYWVMAADIGEKKLLVSWHTENKEIARYFQSYFQGHCATDLNCF